MYRAVWTAIAMLLLLLAGPVAAAEAGCRAVLGPPQEQGGVWRYAFTLESAGWFLAGVQVRERGGDVVVKLQLDTTERFSDVAPSRYSIERAALLLHGPARGVVEVRPFDVALKSPPPIAPLCVEPLSEAGLQQLLWQQLVQRVYRSDTAASSYVQAQARAQAIDFAEQFVRLGQQRGFPRELLAGARHIQGYLAANAARRADARDYFEAARRLWSEVPEPALALAAQFNVAAESLALGKADEALQTLQPLLDESVRKRFAPIWVWASNDACVALRNLERRDEAADCFGRLVPLFDRMDEPKESANALCNQGAALGDAGRWNDAAPVLAGCAQRRERLGFPSGIAHAELLLGWQALETDSVDTAAAHFQRSIAAARQSGEASRVWDARRWLAQTWIDGDELPRARLALAWLAADGTQESSRAAQWHAAMAQLELYSDNRAAALAHLQRAEAQFAQLGQTAALADTRCLHALVDATAGIADDCDGLVAGQALLARGEVAAARQRLQARQPVRDREILRRFLLASHSEAQGGAPLAQIVADAAGLPQRAPRERGERGQLLARIAFELARAGQHPGHGEQAQLALATLWLAGSAPAGFGRRIYGAASAAHAAAAMPVPAQPPLAAGTVLVASTSFLGEGYLLVARADGVSSIRIDMEAVNAAIAAWRDRILDHAASAQAAQSVAAALGLPGWWRPEDRHLVLAVHGALSTLPWSALPVAGEARVALSYRPLLDQATVSHVSGAPAPQAVAAQRAHVRFFPGDIDAGLPGASSERRLIERLAQASQWTTSTSGPLPAGVLHIAGHAVADTVSVDGNRLLAPNDPTAALPFPDELVRHADLVVLAGCETGYGPASRWTLTSSLTSRAVGDGAAAALGHLWPISDTAGMKLHAEFYRGLFQGLDSAESLRRAQLALLDSPRHRLLQYWASPILVMQRPAAAAAPQRVAAITVREAGRL